VSVYHSQSTLFTLFLIFAATLSALDVNEKKAVRREMIELDIAVRNLTSIIAQGDRKSLDDALSRLSSWQMSEHPDLGKFFRGVLAQWEIRGALKYAAALHKEAAGIRSLVGGKSRLSESDWYSISSGLNKILALCRNCHQMLSVPSP